MKQKNATEYLRAEILLRGGLGRMRSNADDRRRMARSLVLIAGIAASLTLMGLLVGVRSFGTQAPPEKLPTDELLARVARAPEEAPAFSAASTVEQSLLPEQLLEAMGQGEGPASSGTLSARIWYGGPHEVRVELQGESGDRVFVKNGSKIWLYDGTTNTLRASEHAPEPAAPTEETITPTDVDRWLAKLAPTSNLTQDSPTRVAGRQAYVLTLTPKDASSTLVERAQALIDSETYLPLQVSLYAQGRSDPVFSWRVSAFDVGPVSAARFKFETPPGAEVSSFEADHERQVSERPRRAEPRRVDTVAEAQRFVHIEISELQSPPGGRELTGVYLKGSDGVVLSYGSGWGTVVLAESRQEMRGMDAPEPDGAGHGDFQLPMVDLGNGVKSQELSTPVGTVLRWSTGGVSYTLAGSVPASELEQAARRLR
jgi:outer membrane lipoprotein-sorting protein